MHSSQFTPFFSANLCEVVSVVVTMVVQWCGDGGGDIAGWCGGSGGGGYGCGGGVVIVVVVA